MPQDHAPSLNQLYYQLAPGAYLSGPPQGIALDGGLESGEEVRVYLDHPLLTDAGAVSYLDYTVGQGNHAIYNLYLRNAGQVSQTAQRGHYTISRVEVSDGYGHLTTYATADLAARGLSSGFDLFSPPANDLDADGVSDIVFRNRAGTLATWFGDTAGGLHFDVTGPYNNQGIDPSWRALEQFGFTGPGGGALLWRNADGRLAVWYGARTTTDSHGATGVDIIAYNHAPIPLDWSIAGTGDFNGDGAGDLLWRNANGALSVWSSTGGTASFTENSYYHAPVDTRWLVEGAADFNGDGRADILWRNRDGALSAWTATDTGFAENRFNAAAATGWRVAEVGDFNRDGAADILWRNDSGAISIWDSTGSGWQQNVYLNAAPGNDWSIVAHDYVL